MLLKILNLVFFALMIYVNFLANSLPINAQTTGMISNSYPNLFAPAGLTFSIWGVIYLLLAVVSILFFFDSNKEILQKVSWFFIISSALNSLWIFAWHYEKFGLSVIIMLLLLASIIIINKRLSGSPTSLFKAGFGIYLGWICIATVANITVWLVSLNWTGFGISNEIWTSLMIAIGLIITVLSVYKFNNPFIAASVIWAFIGIAIKQNGNSNTVFISAIVGTVLFAIIIVLYLLRIFRTVS
ncbi:MAG: tryptophan-rich sensory protein [Bacteroidales bacterium]|nr:tryptophan-rich sensory protein [Bacteroidales bacterium]